MAKYERWVSGEFGEVLTVLEKEILQNGRGLELVDQSDFEVGENRLAVRVYDKYFFRTGSRASLTLTVAGIGNEVFISSIGAGGGEGIAFRMDWGTEEELSRFIKEILDKNSFAQSASHPYFVFRRREPQDNEQIIKLWIEANKAPCHFAAPGCREQSEEEVRKRIEAAEVYVCVIDTEIAGFMELSKQKGRWGFVQIWVDGLFVKEQYRGKSIGRKLLEIGKERYTSLNLTVYEKNHRALQFYERENFEVKGTHQDPLTGEIEINMQWEH